MYQEEVPHSYSTINLLSDKAQVIHYDAEDVLRTFQTLFDDIDFKAEVGTLGFGPLSFMLRKQAIQELQILTIALWGIALERSFPQDAEGFFQKFRETSPFFLGKKAKQQEVLQNKLTSYVELLEPKKEKDFLPIAAYLADTLQVQHAEMDKFRLKLSLLTRNLYNLIFNHLI